MTKRKATASKAMSATYQIVGAGVTAVSYGQDVYPVEGGQVELPPSAAWVQELVADGMLIKGAKAAIQLTLEEKQDEGKSNQLTLEEKQDEGKSKK